MPVSRRQTRTITACSALLIPALMLACASPALARPGGWGGGNWGGGSNWDRPGWDRMDRARPQQDRSREGKVTAESFTVQGDAARALGHGRMAVIPAPTPPPPPPAAQAEADAETIAPNVPPTSSDPRERATYEAAVIDQLAQAGYDTATADPAGGHVTELRITHDVIAPAEAPRKPVSGEMTMGVSNRGSMMGMAINVDMTKPLGALVATRLEARIRDRATNQVLWEGRADIMTRDGDARWTDQAIATRLADALFGDFPGKAG